MFELSFLEDLKRNLDKIKGDFVELFVQNHERSLIFRLENRWRITSKNVCGLSLKIEKGGKTLFKKKQSSDLNKLMHFVNSFNESKLPGKVDIIEKKFSKKQDSSFISHSLSDNLTNIEYDYNDENIKDINLIIQLNKITVSVINKEGILTNEDRYPHLIFARIESKNGKSAAESKMFRGIPSFSEIEAHIKYCTEEAHRMAAYRNCPSKSVSGELPAVFSSRAAGFLLNEAVSHFFEADLNSKTSFKSLIGEKIAPENITIFDAGPLSGEAFFDDEGFEPLKGVVMIEKGKVVNLLTDRNSAHTLSLIRTGNARKASFRTDSHPGVWNLCLPPSNYDENELISKIAFGIYISKLEDGYLSLKKGTFSFPVSEGYIIRDGKISDSVSGIKISQKTPYILNEIELIGNNAQTYGGIRKKGETLYRTFETVPSLLINKIFVSPTDFPISSHFLAQPFVKKNF